MTAADRLFVLLQHALPKRLVSDLVGRACRLEAGPWTRRAIVRFIDHYGVDMREASNEDPASYASFNAFFTRALKPGARPLPADPRLVVSPADGSISQCGAIHADTLLQVKGLSYTLGDLFDGDAMLAGRFVDGSFVTIYLAPCNYHRVHMPLDGEARYLRHVPGALYSVNATTARLLPRLFCRNERVIVAFGTNRHAFALIMIGALNVGSIELGFPPGAPLRNRPPAGMSAHRTDTLAGPQLARGDEFGRFNMGSTVIVLASRGLLEWGPAATEGASVRMGQTLGRLLGEHAPVSTADPPAAGRPSLHQ